jgi:leukotriene A-4 hydrolase/aminopeptidase
LLRTTCWLAALVPALAAQQTTAPATRAAETRDVHSHARPWEARTTHLSLGWAVDFTTHRISGAALFRIEREAGVRELVLDTRDLEIERVTGFLPGTPATPAELKHALAPADPILGAALRIELPDAVDTVEVRYRTSPSATGLQWLAPEQTATRTHPYLFSQAQAIHARSFVPCQDSPGVRVTWDATVRVPKGVTAVMSGRRTERDDGALAFEMVRPVPSYLIAIAVGNLEFREIGPRTGVWSEPGVVERAAFEFADLERMLASVEGTFGAYRWDRYDVLVLPPSFPFGGMENPMMTFATPTLLAGDRSLVNVIAHELAHSWSGNLVTNATWRDFWLNEGFTVYLEGRIIERLYGARVGVQQQILGRNDLLSTIAALAAAPGDTRLYIDLAGRDPDDGMTSVPYQKGSAFLEMLERAVGRARFDAFLKAWFDEHAFQAVTTPRFERFLKDRLFEGDAAALERLDVRKWLYDPGLPSNAPGYDESVFAEPAGGAAGFAAGTRAAGELDAKGWTTDEWLHFLERLPKDLPAARLGELDAAWKLTENGNAEIAAAWLRLAIASRYGPAYPRLERFLTSVGRRKFLKPLYSELAKTDDGLARARAIYAKARPGYHAIATQTLDKILGAPETRPAR